MQLKRGSVCLLMLAFILSIGLSMNAAQAAEPAAQPTAMQQLKCRFFGVCTGPIDTYEEEEDGDWTELPPGSPPKLPKNPNPGCSYPDCGYED